MTLHSAFEGSGIFGEHIESIMSGKVIEEGI